MVRKNIPFEKFTESFAMFNKEQCDSNNKMPKNKLEDPRMLSRRGP